MDFIAEIDKYSLEEGNRVAQIYGETTLTYKQLINDSDALAYYLINKYGKDKTPIVVYGHKEHLMLVCFLACSKSGHPYIPVDTTFPSERVSDIIESSKAKVFFNVGKLEYNCPQIEIRNYDEIKSLLDEFSGCKPEKHYQVQENDVYYILYTSGSTGKPKGVEITKQCLDSFVSWFAASCELANEQGYYLNQISYSFDVSVISLFIGLTSGKTLYVIDKEMIADFKQLFNHLGKSNIALWISTPSFGEMCLVSQEFTRKLLPSLEKMIFAGEVLTNSLVGKMFDRFGEVEIINGYGPTEATVLVTAVNVTRDMCQKIDPLPIGYCMDKCKIIFVDDIGKEVLLGEKGELVIIGDSVSTGYYNNPELSSKVFSTVLLDGEEKRCYKTGDLAYIKDGLIFYSGRKDFQVKLNGFRIELEDVENNLRKLEYVTNCAVLPVSKNTKITHLTAFIRLNVSFAEPQFKTERRIKEDLQRLIPSYMIPRHIKLMDNFPVNTNGKVDRKALMELI